MNSNQNQYNIENILDKFEKIYENLYKRHSRILNKMKKRLKTMLFIGLVLFVAWFILGLLISTSKIAIILSLAFFACYYYFYYHYEVKYIEFYKKEIIGPLLESLDENLIYVRSKNETAEIIQEYRISKFIKVFDNFVANEFIKGYVDNDMFMKMSGLNVKIGAGEKRHILRINTVFSYVVLNKNVVNGIKINTKHKLTKNTFNLNNNEFNEIFQISSMNENKAKEIINNEIMGYLIEFYDKTKINFEIIIKSNRMYIRFFREGMFEPKIWGKSFEKANIMKDLKILFFVLNLGKKINITLKELE